MTSALGVLPKGREIADKGKGSQIPKFMQTSYVHGPAGPLMCFNPVFLAFSILDLASGLDILSPPEMAFGFYLVVEVENVIPDLP